jgi:hypothetical protein
MVGNFRHGDFPSGNSPEFDLCKWLGNPPAADTSRGNSPNFNFCKLLWISTALNIGNASLMLFFLRFLPMLEYVNKLYSFSAVSDLMKYFHQYIRSRVVTCVQTVEYSDLIGSAKEFERSMKGYVYLLVAYLTTPLISQTIWYQ